MLAMRRGYSVAPIPSHASVTHKGWPIESGRCWISTPTSSESWGARGASVCLRTSLSRVSSGIRSAHSPRYSGNGQHERPRSEADPVDCHDGRILFGLRELLRYVSQRGRAPAVSERVPVHLG